MKKNIKTLIIFILIPVVLAFLVGLLNGGFVAYKEIIKPSFAPPGFLFPIVWSILYILMGISSYIIYEKDGCDKALKVYSIQLFVNLFWTVIFFNFRFYFLAFLWILLLIVLVVIMIKEFYKISHKSAYLQIPYLLWIIFACILNFSIFILN